MAASGPKGVIEHRARMLSHYRDVCTKLEDQEKKLHSSFNLSVEAVVKFKNILLFKQILCDAGYDDLGVADYLIEGVKVVGHLERTGIWKELS
eukprot:1334102-Karenia_brevis.AAC.1